MNDDLVTLPVFVLQRVRRDVAKGNYVQGVYTTYARAVKASGKRKADFKESKDTRNLPLPHDRMWIAMNDKEPLDYWRVIETRFDRAIKYLRVSF